MQSIEAASVAVVQTELPEVVGRGHELSEVLHAVARSLECCDVDESDRAQVSFAIRGTRRLLDQLVADVAAVEPSLPREARLEHVRGELLGRGYEIAAQVRTLRSYVGKDCDVEAPDRSRLVRALDGALRLADDLANAIDEFGLVEPSAPPEVVKGQRPRSGVRGARGGHRGRARRPAKAAG